MKSNNSNINSDILKAIRRNNREDEIREYGKSWMLRPVVFRNHKKYNRKNLSDPLKELNAFLVIGKLKYLENLI